MKLLDLPPEILDQIIDWCMPYGFESFVLSCKTVHARSGSRTALHNNLKKRWTYATNKSPRRGDTLRFLHEIAKEPLVSRYIETLSLYDRRTIVYPRIRGRPGRADARSQAPPPESDPDFGFREDDNAMHNIKNLIVASPYFDIANIDPNDWWQEVIEEMGIGENQDLEYMDDSPFATITLLLLLPNLKSLQLSPRWGARRWYVEGDEEKEETFRKPMLDGLMRATHGPDFPEKSLGRLESVMPFMPAGYEVKAGFGHIAQLTLMQSVREVFGTSLLAVDDGYTGIPFHWHIPDVLSNVQRLELAYSCIDAEGMSQIVSRMPKLQVLKYDYQCKWHGCLFEWNPGTFVDAIARHCGGTLTDLAITCCEMPGAIENGIEDFHSFAKLKKLEIDVTVLIGPPISSGQMAGSCGHLPEGMDKWTESNLPCLAIIMPPSLEELHINTDFPADGDTTRPQAIALETLLRDLKIEREKRLPDLNAVIIRQYKTGSARSVAEAEGCTLENWPAEKDAPHPPARVRCRMPLWMREFEDRVGVIEFN